MTAPVFAPVTGPDPVRLEAVARWDADEVRSGFAVLSGVVEELSSSQRRVEAVGRRLAAGSWSGRAGDAAAGSVLGLSAVTAAVTAGMAESLAACRDVAAEAGTAAALARAAALAAPDDPGAGAALAAEALERADRVGVALGVAAAALSGLGVRDAFGPTGFPELSARLRPVPVPVPPTGDARAVAVWWAALPALAQAAFLQQRAPVAGALDGLPAAARDRANRLLLARALRRSTPSPTARAVAAVLDASEAAGEEAQLHLFDEAEERVAVALGDVDAADSVAVLVPGIATTPDDDLDAVTADVSRAVAAAGQAAAGTVAGVAWLGYRPPRLVGILLRRRAAQAGPVLDSALDGMAEARAAGGARPARVTVLAHSYGTVVLDEAAQAPGRLAADAVVLLGSPGTGDSAASFEGAEVYDAASFHDPISWSGWFGPSPFGPFYGADELPVAVGTGHSGYLDPGPTVTAIGDVVAGSGGPSR